jgi:ATP-binding cassette subfamily B multidrug efflux pump
LSKPTNNIKKGTPFNVDVFKRVFALAKPYKAKLYKAIILTISMAFLGPIRPVLIQHTIDNFIATNNPIGLVKMSVLLFAILLVQAGMQVWSTVLTNYLGQHVIKDLRLQVYDYLTGLRLLFYDKTPVGTLVTRTVSDIETIADVFSEGLINISGDLLQIVFILIFMFSLNWKLSLVSLAVLPFLLYAGYVFKEKVRTSFEDVRTQVARLNTFVQEHIQGMQIVQLFGRQQQEFNKFEEINTEHKVANIKSVMYYSVFFPVVEIISAVSTALIVWYASRGIMNGEASIGLITSFIMLINLFFRPIRQLADRFNTMQMGMVAAERIFKLIDEQENTEQTGHHTIPKVQGNIVFDNVWFGYNPNEYVLKGIDINLKHGKNVALVGATGAGKSSIINLLSRFYEIQKGSITVDGHPLQTLNIQELRKQIAVVLQDVFLFSGTVMDNIKLNNQTISDAYVMEVAQKLGAHDFIMRLPDGYQQNVYERGATLSVGQRQLISFVRAMVTNPAVLVLDEATSSVDNETEEVIQNAIATMMDGRTSIVIAHRLSTIQHADEIIVLEKGTIVERGNHQNLLNIDGYYKKLYELQFAPAHHH